MSAVVVDDHLLLRVLTADASFAVPRDVAVATTGLWYHRLCRALCDDSVVGSLTRRVAGSDPEVAVGVLAALVDLPNAIQIVSLRALGWPMGRLAHSSGRRLNLLSLEALAAAQHLSADIWLSEEDDNVPLRAAAGRTGIAVRVVG